MKRSFLLVAIFIIAAAAGYSESLGALINKAGLQKMSPGTQSINFRLDNLSGNVVSLHSYEGKVVLLNFWASWCGPCRSEMPSLESLYKRFRHKGFVVLGVNLQQSPGTIKPFVKKFGLTFPVLLDRSGRVALSYAARALPTTYLINKKGEVTSRIVGAHNWSSPQVSKLIEALVEKS